MLLATPLLLAVAGCMQYWAKPGATRALLDAAKDRCDTEANTRFPLTASGGVFSSSYSAPPGTSCSFGPDGPRCVTYGGMEVDANAQGRAGAFRACMIAGGWLPSKDEADAGMISRSSRRLGPPAASAVRGAFKWCDRMFNERRNATVMAVYHDSLEQCVAIVSRDLERAIN